MATGNGDVVRGGANLPRVADYNRVLIVDLVRRHPGISRAELSQRTGLTTQTVTNICTVLCRQGLIENTGRVSSGVGRSRTVYRIVPTSRYAVGVHIDAARTVLVLVDLAGSVIDRTELAMPATEQPDAVLDLLAEATRQIVRRNHIADEALAGLGVGAPGPIRMRSGTVVGARSLRGWDVVPLRDGLIDRLGVPVQLEKDTVATVTGEVWAGSTPSDNFLFVYFGTGAGAGVVLGGEIMHGSSGNLGNFAHISGDPEGPRCDCGGRGCIRASATPSRIVAQAIDAGVLDGPMPDNAAAIEEAVASIAKLAGEGDDNAAAVLERAARTFGNVITNLVNVLDLDTVVFGGPSWHLVAEPFLRIVPGILDQLHMFGDLHRVTVTSTVLGADVGPIGAASLILARAVSAHSSLLVAQVPAIAGDAG